MAYYWIFLELYKFVRLIAAELSDAEKLILKATKYNLPA